MATAFLASRADIRWPFPVSSWALANVRASASSPSGASGASSSEEAFSSSLIRYEISVRALECLVSMSEPRPVTVTMSDMMSPYFFSDFTALLELAASLPLSLSSTLANPTATLNTIPGLRIAGFFALNTRLASRKSSPTEKPRFLGRHLTRSSLPSFLRCFIAAMYTVLRGRPGTIAFRHASCVDRSNSYVSDTSRGGSTRNVRAILLQYSRYLAPSDTVMTSYLSAFSVGWADIFRSYSPPLWTMGK
mmetsp:Transcript_42876/g.130430  ORF Transcript_42876/g.130430 Transcript_42876/m.130430 type:complete len:249 (-) Transcript_42876:1030-1776(-)